MNRKRSSIEKRRTEGKQKNRRITNKIKKKHRKEWKENRAKDEREREKIESRVA